MILLLLFVAGAAAQYEEVFRGMIKACETKDVDERGGCMYYCGRDEASGRWKYGLIKDGAICKYGTGQGVCFGGLCHYRDLSKPGEDSVTKPPGPPRAGGGTGEETSPSEPQKEQPSEEGKAGEVTTSGIPEEEEEEEEEDEEEK
uniref:ATSP n=1 Tax=Argas monolakensis TaxID=34602 RepID=Q09JN1_ARGMO|nr:ATSP [Argas monolakensis]